MKPNDVPVMVDFWSLGCAPRVPRKLPKKFGEERRRNEVGTKNSGDGLAREDKVAGNNGNFQSRHFQAASF